MYGARLVLPYRNLVSALAVDGRIFLGEANVQGCRLGCFLDETHFWFSCIAGINPNIRSSNVVFYGARSWYGFLLYCETRDHYIIGTLSRFGFCPKYRLDMIVMTRPKTAIPNEEITTAISYIQRRLRTRKLELVADPSLLKVENELNGIVSASDAASPIIHSSYDVFARGVFGHWGALRFGLSG